MSSSSRTEEELFTVTELSTLVDNEKVYAVSKKIPASYHVQYPGKFPIKEMVLLCRSDTVERLKSIKSYDEFTKFGWGHMVIIPQKETAYAPGHIYIETVKNTSSVKHVGTALEEYAFRLSIQAGFHGRVELSAAWNSHCFHYKNGFRSHSEEQNAKIQEALVSAEQEKQRVDTTSLDGFTMYFPDETIKEKEKLFNNTQIVKIYPTPAPVVVSPAELKEAQEAVIASHANAIPAEEPAPPVESDSLYRYIVISNDLSDEINDPESMIRGVVQAIYYDNAALTGGFKQFTSAADANQYLESIGGGAIIKLNTAIPHTGSLSLERLNNRTISRYINHKMESTLLFLHVESIQLYQRPPILNKRYEWYGFNKPKTWNLIERAALNALEVVEKYLRKWPEPTKKLLDNHTNQKPAKVIRGIAKHFLQEAGSENADRRLLYLQFVNDFMHATESLSSGEIRKNLKDAIENISASLNLLYYSSSDGKSASLANLVSMANSILRVKKAPAESKLVSSSTMSLTR